MKAGTGVDEPLHTNDRYGPKLSQIKEAVKTHRCSPVSKNYGILVDSRSERFLV
jgi:hypothetical protein